MARELPEGKWRVLLATDDRSVRSMFEKRGHRVSIFNALTPEPDKYDLVVWNGGADISPYLYGERVLPNTRPYFSRDLHEIDLYHRLSTGIPKFGICRGAQLLNVKAGGRLWQDVDGHYSGHEMTNILDGTTIKTSSIHHQMMIPPVGNSAWVIAESAISTVKKSGIDEWSGEPDSDPEVILQTNINALCVQGHPEYGPPKFTDYCFDMLGIMYNDDIQKRRSIDVQEVHVG